MAPFKVNPDHVREFKTADAFYSWLSKHHDKEDEVWIKIHKVASGKRSITPKEAIDAVLCWGWIDAIRKGLDETSYLQRYTRRGKKSTWSEINKENVARLIAEGRMTEHGLREVDAAKADGRWERAYRVSDNEAPPDLMAAIEAEPKALEMYGRLTAQNRFALSFRTTSLKTAEARARKVAGFVEMLKRGETIYPQKLDAKPRAKKAKG
jgi:uncharacterized protein YdeI (YjbR/CyaY-like superfamily)